MRLAEFLQTWRGLQWENRWGRVVYVATTSDEPVTLFLTPEQSEAVALSLTLVPCGLPPRELTLLVAGGADRLRAAAGETAGDAGQWETQWS